MMKLRSGKILGDGVTYHCCGHYCRLYKMDNCCQCADERPHQDHGYRAYNLPDVHSYNLVNRYYSYCSTCKHRLEKKKEPVLVDFSYMPPNGDLFTSWALQQNKIRVLEKELRDWKAEAKRITALEAMLAVKDQQIIDLQKSLSVAFSSRH